MEFLGINDIINCLKGDIGACVSMVIGALPWGKIFKAKKIAEAIFRAGKAVVTFFQEIKWARAIIQGAEKAAEAAKAAAAAAAKAAAEKAAKARAAAEEAAKKAAAKAAERAKAVAAKAKAATKKAADSCPVVKRKHSFIAGTRVLLADGSTKPIQDVKPGDAVQTGDARSGRTEGRQVTRAIRTDHDKRFVDLAVREADGSMHTVTATDDHPFWSTTRQRWVDAGQLRPGEMLRTSAGTHVQIGAIRPHRTAQRTFDLTVDGQRTYHVVLGATAVPVHNNNDDGDACPVTGRTSYGSSAQSQMAIAHRRQAGIPSGQNVAVYSIELPNGRTANLAFANTPGKMHSEAHADDFIAELGFEPESVKAIYSERNFCTTPNHECAGRIAKYTQASLSWSFERGENAMAKIRATVFG